MGLFAWLVAVIITAVLALNFGGGYLWVLVAWAFLAVIYVAGWGLDKLTYRNYPRLKR